MGDRKAPGGDMDHARHTTCVTFTGTVLAALLAFAGVAVPATAQQGYTRPAPTSSIEVLWHMATGDLVVWGRTQQVPAGTTVTVTHTGPDGTRTPAGAGTVGAEYGSWSVRLPAATTSVWTNGSTLTATLATRPAITVTAPVPRPLAAPADVAVGAQLADAADAAPPGNPDGYQLTRVDAAGRSARWDPCTPIPVRVNLAGAPPRTGEVIADTLARITRGTGWQLTPAGDSTHRWESGLRNGQNARTAGPGITIVFATVDALPVTGLGFSAGITDYAIDPAPGGRLRITGAVVALASDALNSAGRALLAVRRVLLHELGHALGLAHVEDRDQVMSVLPGTPPHYGLSAGDLTGLRGLRSSGCLT